MYALGEIPENTVIASFPKSKLIKPEGNFPENASFTAKYVHSAAQEYIQGNASSYSNFFTLFDPLESLEKCASYFCSDKEVKILSSVSVFAGAEVARQQAQTKALIDALCEFDSSIGRDVYTFITLNYHSRAIGRDGFVPIIECFNHSNSKGAFIENDADAVLLKTNRSYSPGEEVFISYGNLDILNHAINYNYFAEGADHYLRFGKRFQFPVLDQSFKTRVEQLSKLYDVRLMRHNGMVYCSVDHEDAHFSMGTEPQKIMEIMSTLFPNADVRMFLAGRLAEQIELNKIDQFAIRYFPARIKRFYNVLKKERQILQNNVDTLKGQ
jgi:hypothetical protein